MVLATSRSVLRWFPRSVAARVLAVFSVLAIALVWLPTGTAFAASTSVDFTQCSNDNNTLGDCNWINSALIPNNSQYREGMSVPQRLILKDFPATGNNGHSLDFQVLATKGGVHAYDWLTSWDQAEQAAINGGVPFNALGAQACDPANSLPVECAALLTSPNHLQVVVPDDPFVSKDGATQQRIDAYESTYGSRTIDLYGNAPITGAALTLSHDVADGQDTGDSYIDYSLTWTSAATQVMVLMAGHLAVGGTSGANSQGWGAGLGSSAVSGGPYHFKLLTLDSSALGNQDNQIQSGAIQAQASTIVTTATSTAQVGTGIQDSATITPSNATGTVTFNLYSDSACQTQPVFTSTGVAVVNGTATSGTYTPTTSGTYYWQATFTPTDTTLFSPAVGACGDTTNGNAEVTTVTKIPTGITTTATDTTVGGTVHDSASITPTAAAGTVVFKAYTDSSCQTTPAYTSDPEPVVNGTATSGDYTTTAAGSVYWQATFTPTDGGKYASATGTCGDQSNGNDEVSSVAKAQPTITTVASGADLPSGTISDIATLSGGYNPTGSIVFTIYGSLDGQGKCADVVDTVTVAVSGNGSYSATENDVVPAGDYYWLASYSGDSNNESATHGCPMGVETSTVNPATPTLQTTATDATLPAAGGITDTATLSGGYNPTGTLSFSAYLGDDTCTGTPAYTTQVAVNGNKEYAASFVPTTAGTYYWLVTYSGDGNNNPASEPCGDLTAPNHEQSVVSPASPTISTDASSTTSTSGSVSDTATLTGLTADATGTVTFDAYDNDACTGTPVFTSTVPLANGGASSGAFTPTGSAPAYYWIASYSGDQNNTPVAGACGDAGETSHVPVLSAAKTSNPGNGSSVLPGEQINYTITVTNSGTADGTTSVTDAIPTGTSYVAGSAACPQGITCTITTTDANGTITAITWAFSTPAGSAAAVTFSVTVDQDQASCTSVVNQGVVNGTPTNSVSQTVVFPSLTASLDADPTPMAPDNTGGVVRHGQTITYTISFGNQGSSDAVPSTLTAPVPEGTTYVDGSASDGGELADGVVTWALDIAAGGSGSRTYQVTVDNDDANGFLISNQAHLATVPGTSPVVTTNGCSAPAAGAGVFRAAATGSIAPVYALDTNVVQHVVFVPQTALAVTKGVDKTAAALGDTLTYTLTVTASGNENQTNVVVSDILPGYNPGETSGKTTYVDGSAACSVTCTTAFDGTTHTVTWTVATMTPGETETFSYQVTIDTPAPAADGSNPPETIRNVGAVQSTETPSSPSNVVTTTTVAVLPLKITRPTAALPFTGSGLPLGPASLVAVMMIGLGLAMSATRRKPSTRGRHMRVS